MNRPGGTLIGNIVVISKGLRSAWSEVALMPTKSLKQSTLNFMEQSLSAMFDSRSSGVTADVEVYAVG